MMFNSETSRRGLSSIFGTVSFKPLVLARPSMPIPPKKRQRVRNVQTGISISAIFMMGQLAPQKREIAARRTKPIRGSRSVLALGVLFEEFSGEVSILFSLSWPAIHRKEGSGEGGDEIKGLFLRFLRDL